MNPNAEHISEYLYQMLSQHMVGYGIEPSYYTEYTVRVIGGETDKDDWEKAEMLTDYVMLESETRGVSRLCDYDVSVLEEGDKKYIFVQLAWENHL